MIVRPKLNYRFLNAAIGNLSAARKLVDRVATGLPERCWELRRLHDAVDELSHRLLDVRFKLLQVVVDFSLSIAVPISGMTFPVVRVTEVKLAMILRDKSRPSRDQTATERDENLRSTTPADDLSFLPGSLVFATRSTNACPVCSPAQTSARFKLGVVGDVFGQP